MSLDPPLVSLVVPVYNQRAFLAEALESVLTQADARVELIALDDGSDDGTSDLLGSFAGRLRWERHENMGQARTLNKGWGMASGELLGYLSADDRLEPGALAAAWQALRAQPDAVAAYCDYFLIDEASRVLRRIRPGPASTASMYERLVCPVGPGALFRRSAFEAVGGWNPDLPLLADLEFWLRLSLLGPLAYVPAVHAAFRAHQGSLTQRGADPAMADEPLRLTEALLARPDLPRPLRDCAGRSRAAARLFSGQLHLRARRYRLGFRRLVEAVRFRPSLVAAPTAWRRIANAFAGRLVLRALGWRARRRQRSA